MILKLFAHLGSNFDCASQGEIKEILDLGVHPNRIIFANPIKDKTSLRYASKMGIDYMTFDSSVELGKIKEHHSTAKCLLRIKTNDSKAKQKLSTKFGATMKTSFDLVHLAKCLQINLVGVAFHVGCSNMNVDVFEEEITKARELFEYARDKCGIEMSVLDLGGGFSGSEVDHDTFVEFSAQVNKMLDRLFPDNSHLTIIAEPGRFLCQPSLTLCTRVIGKRIVDQNGDELTTINETNNCSCMYYLNCGFYSGLIEFCELKWGHSISKLADNSSPSSSLLATSTLWGPTCDSLDVIVKNKLMLECNVDDYILFKGIGAYSNTISTKFNSLPLPEIVYASFGLYQEYYQAFVMTME
jgi:ornithine decarboxylase